MSIHAHAQAVETASFPGGRSADDGFWYGSGKAAFERYPSETVGRPGKTRDDKLPVADRSRCRRA